MYTCSMQHKTKF